MGASLSNPERERQHRLAAIECLSLLADIDEAERSWLMPPTLYVTGEKLALAIEQVEKFADWLEIEIDTHVYRR
jgi:hypothetical protein